MRILRVIHSTDRRNGGPIEGAIQVTKVLAEMGHVTEMASLDAPDAPWFPELPFPVHPFGPAKSEYGYSGGLIPWLRRNAGRYDHVIVHGVWQFHSLAVRQALHGQDTPYVVYTHGMLDPWFKQAYPLKHLKKSLYWPWAESRVLRDAQAVLFTTEEERLLARQSFQPYRCREIVVSYGTGNPPGDPAVQRELFFQSFPDLRGKRLILFLSRLHVKKGCDLLLDAFAGVAGQDPDLRLVMAGPDNYGLQASLEASARDKGIADRISWPGMLSGDLKWGAFHAAEVFALPSHQENFGIAVAEALACGVPVLISDKVNIWREVEADGAGLVAPDDSAGTARLLGQWLALTGEERQAMRGSALRCFESRFEIHRAAESLIETLTTLDSESAAKEERKKDHVGDSGRR